MTGALFAGAARSGSGAHRNVRPYVSLLAAAFLGSTALASQGLVPSSSAAAACTLRPVIRDYTVSQGLSSYVDLARGKDTLVRFYLSMPSCASAGAAIQLVSATLDVKAGPG